MVVIRLARHGSRHKPFYHVTVADQRARRDGAFIERVGYYNPIARGNAQRLHVDLPRVDYWISKGAQTSGTVTRLVKEARRAAQLEALKPVEEATEVEASSNTEDAAEAAVEEASTEDVSSETVEASSNTEEAVAVAEEPAAEESEASTDTSAEASAESAAEESENTSQRDNETTAESSSSDESK